MLRFFISLVTWTDITLYNRAMRELTFIKLGGSLITDKTRPYTPRLDVLQLLAYEILDAQRATPGLPIVLGHGSGSFGHTAAKKHGTRQGVASPEGWQGFNEVWWQGRQWSVTSYGLEQRSGNYVIERARLCEQHKAADQHGNPCRRRH